MKHHTEATVGAIVVVERPSRWSGALGEVMYRRRGAYPCGVLIEVSSSKGCRIRHFADTELLVIEEVPHA